MGRRSYELVVSEHAPSRYVEALLEIAGQGGAAVCTATHERLPSAGKVALFLPSLGGGGAERAMLDVATGLAQRGLSVDMVLVKAEGQYVELAPEYVRLVDLGSHRIAASLPKLLRYLWRERPAVVLSTLAAANVVALTAKLLMRGRFRLVVRQEKCTCRWDRAGHVQGAAAVAGTEAASASGGWRRGGVPGGGRGVVRAGAGRLPQGGDDREPSGLAGPRREGGGRRRSIRGSGTRRRLLS